MNYKDYLLTKLAEECGELAQVASKMNVFGVNSYDPADETKTTNEQHMNIEFNDVLAVMEMVKELLLLDVDRDESLIEAKKNKIDKMWNIAKRVNNHE